MTVCAVIEFTVLASSPEEAIEKAEARAHNLMKRRPSINIGVEHDVNYNVRDSEGNFIHETQS